VSARVNWLGICCLCAAAFGQTLHPEAKLDAPVPIRRAVTCEAGAAILGVGEDGAIYTWTLPATAPRKISLADGPVSRVECAGAHTLAAELRHGRKVFILDARSGEVRQRIDAQAPVQAIALSPDGSLLAVATSLFPTQLWNTQTGTRIATGVTNIGAAWTTAFSPTGEMYVAADEDTNLRAYNRSGKLLYAADGGVLEPFALAFSGNGKQFAAAGADGVIRVFDSASGKLLASSTSVGHPIFALTMSPDGQRVASLSVDDFRLDPLGLGVWDVRSGEVKPLAVEPKSCVGMGAGKSHTLLLTKTGENALQVSSLQ
jgi:WD40 repeat protein